MLRRGRSGDGTGRQRASWVGREGRSKMGSEALDLRVGPSGGRRRNASVQTAKVEDVMEHLCLAGTVRR